jgi:hypothetical protein
MVREFALFYHVWCSRDLSVCRLLVDEQLKRIFRAGLAEKADVLCCISGKHHERIKGLVEAYDWVRVLVSTSNESQYEGLTLRRLHNWCVSRKRVKAVGYVHTKGVQYFNESSTDRMLKAVNSWRHLMEWGVIDRWPEALEALGRYDAVGVNYREDPFPHFGGNFWWADADYVRGLIPPHVGTFPAHEYPFILQTGEERRRVTERLDFERWLGLKSPKVFSFYGFPFEKENGVLDHEHFNLYDHDIEPYYRRFNHKGDILQSEQ